MAKELTRKQIAELEANKSQNIIIICLQKQEQKNRKQKKS